MSGSYTDEELKEVKDKVYYKLIKRNEHSGRLRGKGKGVTKMMMKYASFNQLIDVTSLEAKIKEQLWNEIKQKEKERDIREEAMARQIASLQEQLSTITKENKQNSESFHPTYCDENDDPYYPVLEDDFA